MRSTLVGWGTSGHFWLQANISTSPLKSAHMYPPRVSCRICVVYLNVADLGFSKNAWSSRLLFWILWYLWKCLNETTKTKLYVLFGQLFIDRWVDTGWTPTDWWHYWSYIHPQLCIGHIIKGNIAEQVKAHVLRWQCNVKSAPTKYIWKCKI